MKSPKKKEGREGKGGGMEERKKEREKERERKRETKQSNRTTSVSKAKRSQGRKDSVKKA